jgi:hypothetical protein
MQRTGSKPCKSNAAWRYKAMLEDIIKTLLQARLIIYGAFPKAELVHNKLGEWYFCIPIGSQSARRASNNLRSEFKVINEVCPENNDCVHIFVDAKTAMLVFNAYKDVLNLRIEKCTPML